MNELEAKLEALQKHQSDTTAEITNLERKIEESKKPKLRHGDYGYAFHSGSPRVYMSNGAEILWCDDEEIVNTTIEGRNIITGNIFDDLDALKENVDEFEIKCGSEDGMRIRFYTPSAGGSRITIYGTEQNRTFYLTEEHLAILPLKISQFAATLKRKAAK